MQKRDTDRILALIPAWNEAPTIGGIVEAVGLRLPVLVIDDGSTDGTAEVARGAGALVISHPTNLRKGAALKTGFAWALARGYEAVLTMDADGQHHPHDIEKLLAAYRNGRGDLIIGERDFALMPWPNRYTTPLGSLILSLALGTRVTDNQSGLRLLTRGMLESMRLRSDGYEMEVEMIWEAVRLGMTIAWVPIRTIYFRDRKSGFRPLMDTLLFLRMVFRIWLERLRRTPARREEICARASVDQQEPG
jgi:UDP-N-acetylglucosamine---dolichyl-phosphate N-acetylglucosaminyltransferase